MDPTVWGPHYWFVLHSIAHNYPHLPTSTQRKVHYRLIHNLHEFLPHKEIAGKFSKLLEAFPVSPYLDSRTDFIRWMHFIHNKINESLHKPDLGLHEHKAEMKHAYSPQRFRARVQINQTRVILYAIVIFMMLLVVAMYR